MKKYIALFLALAMVFALAACGQAQETKPETPASEETGAVEAKDYEVVSVA